MSAILSVNQDHTDWMNPEYVPGLVSVIIPTYNRAHLITHALDSVRNQTYRPIELIVVDDGSVDDTESVVRSWIESHASEDMIVFYIRQENRGAPSARNIGLQQSTGQFIQFFDSDDRIIKQKISHQVEALRSFPNASFVWSDRSHAPLDEAAAVQQSLEQRQHDVRAAEIETVTGYQKMRVPASIVTGLYRRSACITLGNWEECLKRQQDWEYAVRFIVSDMWALYLPGTYYVVVGHDGPRVNQSHTNNYNLFIEACRMSEEKLHKTNKKAHPENIKAARYKIAVLYMSAVIASLDQLSHDNFRLAIKGLCRNKSNDFPLNVKATTLRLLASVLGLKVTRRICHWYLRKKP